jgi:hypothetical protein
MADHASMAPGQTTQTGSIPGAGVVFELVESP